jgi:predicted 3-demethylubiquinone-9 3-methyltransferase (glyoxalase superfamily)
MKPKNTICLWFNKDAEEAARFYAATFPDSKVTAVNKAPGDYPDGKKGDVLTVEFTVLGIPCLGLQRAILRRLGAGGRRRHLLRRQRRFL